MGNKSSRSKKKKKKTPTQHPLHHLWQQTEMYPNTKWNQKDLQRVVTNGTIAPLIPGSDDPIPNERILSECPICFMYYAECTVNVASCCAKPMCSQCYCSVQTSPEAKNACCPFCTSPTFSVAPMVKGVQFPDRYGLDAKSFQETIKLISKQDEEESVSTVQSRTTPSNSVSVEERFEQQERMADLSDLAEVERVTSPSLAPYHLSPSSQPNANPSGQGPPSMSLGGNGGSGGGGGGGGGRMNSIQRAAWQRGQLADIFGQRPDGQRIATSNSNVRMAIEQMMMEEAIRLSLGTGASSQGEEKEVTESTQQQQQQQQQQQDEEGMDDDLAAAIRASLEEANVTTGDSKVNDNEVVNKRPANAADLSIGSRIVARWIVSNRVAYPDFYPGKIVHINTNGTYNIEFDDGYKRSNTPLDEIGEEEEEEFITDDEMDLSFLDLELDSVSSAGASSASSTSGGRETEQEVVEEEVIEEEVVEEEVVEEEVVEEEVVEEEVVEEVVVAEEVVAVEVVADEVVVDEVVLLEIPVEEEEVEVEHQMQEENENQITTEVEIPAVEAEVELEIEDSIAEEVEVSVSEVNVDLQEETEEQDQDISVLLPLILPVPAISIEGNTSSTSSNDIPE